MNQNEIGKIWKKNHERNRMYKTWVEKNTIEDNLTNCYLWCKSGKPPEVIRDLIVFLQTDNDYDPEQDAIYEIGDQIKIKLKVEIEKPTKYRNG